MNAFVGDHLDEDIVRIAERAHECFDVNDLHLNAFLLLKTNDSDRCCARREITRFRAQRQDRNSWVSRRRS